MNENSIFFAVDKIEDKFIEEAAQSAMEENSVQPIFITPTQKKTKKPIFAIASIAACFALIFGVGIAVRRNSGIEITQPPLNIEETTTAAATTTPADTSISDATTPQAVLKTPIDTVTEGGVPIKSTAVFTEEDKAEILEAYKALKVYFDKHFNSNYPNAGRYIVSIDDVRHGDGLYSTRYTLESGFKPTKEFEFWVTFDHDHKNFSSSHKNEWYIASKFNGEWTTYSEYMDTPKTPIDTTTEIETQPPDLPPNNWHNEGYIIPENWLPIMKNDEAFENLDSLFNEPQAGKSISEIIQNLVNRNIVAVDIFYGWGPSFTEEYKVEEPNFGVVNPHTGKTNLYAIKSDYFSSLEEIENIMNKTYTSDLAHERLYGQDGDRQIFIERDNKLFVDYNCMYIWSALPFEDDSYIEIITDDEEECFFNYHFILWDPFDYENNHTEEWYPHHYIVTLRAVKENGEWRLCSFVFNNPNYDYIDDTANLVSLMEKIIGRAKTVEEMTAKLKTLGGGYKITKVSVYKNSTDLQNGAAPIENGALESGMYVRVDYDEESYFEQTIA